MGNCMSLIDRLSGVDGANEIATHQFYSALVEWDAGEMTRATIVSHFVLSVDDETDLDWLKGKLDASANKKIFLDRIHNIFLLAEAGFPGYQSEAELVAIINGMG